MKSIKYYFLPILLALSFWNCENAVEDANNHPVNESTQTALARDFLSVFLKSSHGTRQTLSKALQPKRADIEAIFIDTAIQNEILDYTERLFKKEKFNIKCFPDYNQVLIWTASVEDFETGTGDAIEFPSSFFKIIPFLKKKTVVHRFKLVQEGYPAGASYEGLFYINGRWVLFPKVWKILDDF
ncbi:MAG: hypothetical protein ACPG19_04595 [Saprospiraceae bacterium]